MAFYILDPNLIHGHGHHLDWDLSIARAALARDLDVVILTHLDFKVPVDERIKIIPYFKHTTYAKRSTDPISGRYDDFKFFNDTLFYELSALPVRQLRPTDTVFIPTLTENHLLGYIAWVKTFEPTLAPLFVVHLMFSSGLDVDPKGTVRVADELQALLYRLAFSYAADCSSYVKYFGGGRQLAREYSALTGFEVGPHALPLCPKRLRTLSADGRQTALLFAGDAKMDKGVALLPALVARLSDAFPEWNFVIHINTGQSWGEALAVCEHLEREQELFPNLQLHTGRLDRGDYLTLLEDAHCVVLTYDPIAYARKSSGVLWESISLGIPMLVPDNCWLANEAAEWRAGYLRYAPYNVDGIASAFAELANRLDGLRAYSADAAHRYQALNGPEAVLDQIVDSWLPRFMAASLAAPPEARAIPLADVTGSGWYELENSGGSFVRWTAREAEIIFDWPYPLRWEIEVEVRKFIGTDQVTKAMAVMENSPLPIQSMVGKENSATLVIRGSRGRPNSPANRVRLVLPYTYKPPHELRELGILISRIQVRAASLSKGDELAIPSTVELLTPVVWDASDASFMISDIVSGIAVLDPKSSAEFAFTIETEADPDVVKSLRLFVNGLQVRASAIADARNTWSVIAACPAHIISAAGYKTEWEILVNRRRSNTPLRIRRLTISGHPLQPPKSVIDFDASAVRDGARSADVALEETSVAVEVGILDKQPQKTSNGSLQAGFSDQQSVAFVTAEELRLDEYYSSGTYHHLGVSLISATIGSMSWPQVKFKFGLSQNGRSLEFRKMEGWPDMFVDWPAVEKDEHGFVYRLYDDVASVEAIKDWRESVDQKLIALIMIILPAAIGAAARKAERSPSETAMWRKEAIALSSNFLRYSGMQRIPTNEESDTEPLNAGIGVF